MNHALIAALQSLRDAHLVVALKSEFEAEGSRFEDVLRFQQVAQAAKLPLVLKIGGCEALRDVQDARLLGITHLVAPMIESPYALQKFVQGCQKNLPASEFAALDLGITLESITGFEQLEAMLASPAAATLSGLTFGRTDFAGSLGESCKAVNSPLLLEKVSHAAQRCHAHGRRFTLGGGVSYDTLAFCRCLPAEQLHRIETRNVVLDAQALLAAPNPEITLLKVFEFETLWLESKQAECQRRIEAETPRLQLLQRHQARLHAALADLSHCVC